MAEDRRILNEQHPGPVARLFSSLSGAGSSWLKWIWLPFGIAAGATGWLLWLVKWGLITAIAACLIFAVWIASKIFKWFVRMLSKPKVA